ncbi:ArnT family glycosyltransferase [Elusimicrobiota bacterium]
MTRIIRENSALERMIIGILLVLAIASVVLSAFAIMKYPLVYTDEASYTEPGWTWLKHGHFGSLMYEGWVGLGKSVVVFGKVHMGLCAMGFALLGTTPAAPRLISFIAALAILGFSFLIGRRLFNAKISFAGILLMASSQLFWRYRDARPDTLVVMFIVASIWLFLKSLDTKSRTLIFISGYIAALAADAHMNGIAAPFLLVLLTLMRYSSNDLEKKMIAPLCAGFALGGIQWLILHIFLDPQLFFMQWNEYWGLMKQAPIYSPLAMIPFEITRYLNFVVSSGYYRYAVYLIIAAITVIWGMRERSSGTRTLLWCYGGIFTFLTLAVANKTISYLVTYIPFFYMLLAAMILRLAGSQKKLLNAASVVILISIIGVHATDSFLKVWQYKDSSLRQYTQRLRTHIPADTAVMGSPTLWFGFSDRTYYSTDLMDFYLQLAAPKHKTALGGSHFLDMFRHKNIRYLIINDSYKQNIDMYKSMPEAREFFESHTKVIATVNDRFYGPSSSRGNLHTEIRQVIY